MARESKTYKKVRRNSTENISKSKDKRRKEIISEKYQEEMGKYHEMLTEERKSQWQPDKTILIYACQNNKRHDLEFLHSRHKLKVNLKILLRHAVLHGHEGLAVWFLQNGANFEKMFKRSSLLHFAASKGYSGILNELLKHHPVDINAEDNNRETALGLALRIENPQSSRILLESGAKTDIPDQDGVLPLHRVARDSNNTKMIDLLLEFKADIEALDEHKKRPLEYGFGRTFNKQAVVCHLIRHGANIGTTFDSNGPFHGKSAVQVGHMLGMTKRILREVRNRSSKTKVNDISVLDCVDLTGDVGALVDLLKEDGDISTLCELNKDAAMTRLMRYVDLTGSHRLRRCMQERCLLADDKSPPDVQKQYNIGKSTIAKSLPEENLSKNEVEDEPVSKSEQGQSEQHVTVLHFEAFDGHEYILAMGDGELTNKQCRDALDLVVVVSPSEDEESILKVVAFAAQHLVNAAHGVPGKAQITFIHIPTNKFLADPSLPNRIHSDPQCSTLSTGSKVSVTNNAFLTKTFQISETKFPYDCYPLHHSILYKRIDEMEKILHNLGTVDVNATDEAGWTALHLAILLGECEMVKMLLAHGADVSSYTAHYFPAFIRADWNENFLRELSPLILSVRLNLTDIVQLLTERNPGNPDMDICMTLSYGMKTESTLLESVCKEAERKYQDIGARFKPAYTVHLNQPIERVCLGFSDDAYDIEKKEKMHGVNVVIMNMDISPESNWNEISEMREDEEFVCKSIIDIWADYLWNRHPNLNAITAGSLVSVKCQEAKPAGHIMLHCSHKGYIPLESNSFPTELTCEKGTMPVALLEGTFRLSPLDTPSIPQDSSDVFRIIHYDNQGQQETNSCDASDSATRATKRFPMTTDEHHSLKIGMHLCKSHSVDITAYEGTVGTFVEMDNGKTGFITCAHLFYKEEINDGNSIHFTSSQRECGADVIAPFDHFSEEYLRGVSNMEIGDNSVDEAGCYVEHGRNVYWECGKVVRAVFDPTLPTGIDAALVEIDPDRAPCDGSFDDIKRIHLRNAKMNWRHPPTFTSGKQADTAYLDFEVSTNRPIKCMKLGASSGLSVGILTWKHGQVRTSDSPPLGIERDSIHKYVMKGQFVISEYNGKQFFECGDSGSAVFVMKGGGGSYYPDACLGIAIGFLDKKTFVTPIGAILETLKSDNAPALALKKFK